MISDRNAAVNNARFSKYLPDLQNQNFINYNEVFSQRWYNKDVKNYDVMQKMMAEILIDDIVCSRYIRSVYVKSPIYKKAVEDQFGEDLKIHNINIIVDPTKFF